MRGQNGALGNQTPHLGLYLTVMHLPVLSEFRTSDRKRQLVAAIRRSSEAHALKWPLERPAILGKAIEKDLMGRDRVDQKRTGLACDDRLHHRQGMRGFSGKQWTDVARCPPVPDQCRAIGVCDQP